MISPGMYKLNAKFHIEIYLGAFYNLLEKEVYNENADSLFLCHIEAPLGDP